ncbi:LOW QUALITY PROTEIN: non-specific lipid-transfer protein 1-like [Spinacia oleracea]|uniref:Non-specific lipid-transfer protein n=1 Tax=Spinacia oleracea TaxID=3562 RepID=A0A9R0IPI1_SPIOL|nr:LOW QUALITY PROTEIN: non-specific lipid-transfer protein 1-like [Spinacia oleracea]
MDSSAVVVKLGCALLIMCMLMHVEAAVTCGQVTSSLAPCIGYLEGNGSPSPAKACCGGIKSLNSMASTPDDRKAACGCLKSAAASVKGINYSAASSLPAKCGVNIPYPFSTSTDCSKIN